MYLTVLSILAAGILAIAWVSAIIFAKRKALLEERLGRLAQLRGGRVAPSPWHAYPIALIPGPGGDVQVSIRHAGHRGRPNRPFVRIAGKHCPRGSMSLERRSLKTSSSGSPKSSARFEEAFELQDPDRLSQRLITSELRDALLAFDPKRRVSLHVGSGPPYRDGRWLMGEEEPQVEARLHQSRPEPEDFERLVDLAFLLQKQLAVHTSSAAA